MGTSIAWTQYHHSSHPCFTIQANNDNRHLETVTPAIEILYDIGSLIIGKVCSYDYLVLDGALGNYTGDAFTREIDSSGVVFQGSPNLFTAKDGLLCKPHRARCRDYTKTFKLSKTSDDAPINGFCIKMTPNCGSGNSKTSMDLTAVSPSLTKTFKVSCKSAMEKSMICLVSNEMITSVKLKANYRNYNIQNIAVASSCGEPVIGD
jgi:hypothetical protein